MFSPAAVDLGGLLIFPRREDFATVSADTIADIFAQVCLKDDDFTAVKAKLAQVAPVRV